MIWEGYLYSSLDLEKDVEEQEGKREKWTSYLFFVVVIFSFVKEETVLLSCSSTYGKRGNI
jgi:hypothetical protein